MAFGLYMMMNREFNQLDSSPIPPIDKVKFLA
jgi:hypothetical protein